MLGFFVATLSALAIVAAGALVVTTTVQHRAIATLTTAVENVSLADEMTLDLLMHARTAEPVVRREFEHDLRRRFDAAASFATTAEERSSLATAEAAVEGYLDGAERGDGSPRLETAYAALKTFVDLNVEQSRAAHDRAESWDRFANVLGTTTAVLVLGGMAMLLVWLRGQLFEPLIALAGVIRRFGDGERSSRAEERGPEELREMAQRFNEMADNLARRRESQFALLGGIAHDLRNPLSALKLTTSQLAGATAPSEDALRGAFDLVRRQIDRLGRLVGDLMDMATIEAGKFDLVLADHDLVHVAGEVVELFRASTRDHPIVLRSPDASVVTRCDATRMSQVLHNLIGNAVKYSPTGSAVEVEVAVRAREAVVRVVDHGIGIPKEEQRFVFDPFRRLDAATSTASGAGLGLFVAALLVDAHGGRIELESEPGRGSCFTVILARTPASAQEDAAGPSASSRIH